MHDKPDLIGTMSLNEPNLIDEYKSKYVKHVRGEYEELPVSLRLFSAAAKDEEQLFKLQDEYASTTITYLTAPATIATNEPNAQLVTVRPFCYLSMISNILNDLQQQQHTNNTTIRLKMALARGMSTNDKTRRKACSLRLLVLCCLSSS